MVDERRYNSLSLSSSMCITITIAVTLALIANLSTGPWNGISSFFSLLPSSDNDVIFLSLSHPQTCFAVRNDIFSMSSIPNLLGLSRATASSDPSQVVQEFLRSLQGGQGSRSEDPERPFTTLPDLLPPSTTIPLVESADEKMADHLLSFLPPALLLLAQDIDDVSAVDTNPATAQAALQSLDLSQKKDILRRVLRSPQFTQSLGSLTVALRDGGLPSISEALKVPVENGGFMRRGGVPLGGGDAVEAFLEGIRRQVKEKRSNPNDSMETD